MPQHLTDEQRHLIVYLNQKGIPERKIALKVSILTPLKLLQVQASNLARLITTP